MGESPRVFVDDYKKSQSDREKMKSSTQSSTEKHVERVVCVDVSTRSTQIIQTPVDNTVDDYNKSQND